YNNRTYSLLLRLTLTITTLFPYTTLFRSLFISAKKAASDACGYPDSPTRLLREVPQAPFEHRFLICGCAFWRTLLTATSLPLAVVFFFLLRLGRLYRQDPIHVVLDGQQFP